MPSIGPMMMGQTPPDWRVFLECSRTPATNVAWTISPEVANVMTEHLAKQLSESLFAFLRTLVKDHRGR